ncbi:phosphate acetyltransferase [Actinobacteria bacterium YIM 96077]|uniref:Phosphate acetyltransferase n=1 Tax=Phytoactinopolyspora halophila TaxID=1981511 RepID=A0A329QHL5_9ACTN|nr:phosphate acetyltransferase [Phytoactinopolyspora halophila]AYY14423.1 phosphate acetyltransferase [Actinobacteria bacterium YIM 96077]RAW11855.1 phosphate acetyltransferase [Phytoactinopolyspora halophila]
MARNVYLASVTGETGKSTVALGILTALTRRIGRVGVFRPIVRSSAGTARPAEPAGQDGSPDSTAVTAPSDYVLDLLLAHDGVDLPYEMCAGVTYKDVHADRDAALGTIVDRYHRMAEHCDAVLVVGSDYTDVDNPTEFSFNARIAANLGTPLLLVLNGRGRSPEELRAMADSAATEVAANSGQLLGIVANRVEPDAVDTIRTALGAMSPAFALPEEQLLSAPTVADLVDHGGTLYRGDPAHLGREVHDFVIAGMTLPHVLDRLTEGSVVITPSDRSDVLIGVLMAHSARTFPALTGVVLNGGFDLPPQITNLIDGLDVNLPIITMPGDTFTTATALAGVRGRLTRDATRKVETALTLFDEHVDEEALLDLVDVAESSAVTPLMFEHRLVDRARQHRRHIVLPEGVDERILRAADSVLRRGIADLTVLGDPDRVREAATHAGADVSAATIIDPHRSAWRERFAEEYARRRAHKGATVEAAHDQIVDVSYFGTMMVLFGYADGMVSGAIHTTADTIRPAFEVIKTGSDVSTVSSVFFMCLRDRVLVYGDCAVNPDPRAEQLADIAISSAQTAEEFGVPPRVAMLSYSTGESGTGADVDKVRTATTLARSRRPDLSIEGPIQYDAAVDAGVARTKLPDSEVAGRATVFVFPDLNTGNNTYKAVQRSADAVAIGPVLQGLRKPVNDLSRGAQVRDIVNTIAITAIQAQAVGEDAAAAKDATR